MASLQASLLWVLALMASPMAVRAVPSQEQLDLAKKQADILMDNWKIKVKALRHIPGWPEPPTKESELEELFNRTLEPDFAVWRKRAPFSARTVWNELQANQTKRGTLDCKRMMLYKDGVWYYLNQHGYEGKFNKISRICKDPCYGMVSPIGPGLTNLTRHYKLDFPNNILFYYNGADIPACHPGECAAPVLSVTKEHRNEDVVVPYISRPIQEIGTWETPFYFFPWEKKTNWAVFRGSGYCSAYGPGAKVFAPCPRHVITWLSQEHYPGLINCTMSTPIKDYDIWGVLNPWYNRGEPRLAKEGEKFNAPGNPYMPEEEHARHKFLLVLDGIAATYRHSKVMRVNSVLVRMNSSFVEYFDRGMQPFVHFLPILKDNTTDIVDIMREYSKPERDGEMRQMAMASQVFAWKYVQHRSRALFWVRTMKMYKSLFPDMDDFVEKELWPSLQDALKEDAQQHPDMYKDHPHTGHWVGGHRKEM